MRLVLVFVALLALYSKGKCQELVVYSGLSNVAMGDLKNLQKIITANSVQLPYLYPSSFPIYWQHGMSLTGSISKKSKLGFNAFITSTGARSGYADYSGTVRWDFLVKCTAISIHYEYLFWHRSKNSLSAFVEPGLIFSNLTISSFFELGPFTDSKEEKFKSISSSLEFGFMYKYFLTKRIFVFSKIGLLLNADSPLKNEISPGKIEIAPGRFAEADWSGLKLLGGLGFKFK
jgi:hypothetical protein